MAAGYFLEIDADVPFPRVPARQRRGQGNVSILIAGEFGDQRRQVPVDFADMGLPVQLFDGGGERHDPPPRMKSSSASMHSFEGRSNQTPRDMPAAGSIPRRNR